jgi:WD40-like Beta Propeller Repeat
MRRSRGFALFALAGCASLAFAAAASAEPGPIKLISQLPSEQAQSAISPAISADGHYVAFQGDIGGAEGVFREDLTSGSIALVAAMSGSSAEPSISADGRYVSFTTSLELDPGDDTNFSPDVYVADMSTTPPSYELASALSGCDPSEPSPHPVCGLIYEGVGGSEASGRVAFSADGRSVVFGTTAASNLGGVPDDTPAGQVVLRNLTTSQTTLVSVERDAATGEMTSRPVEGGAEITTGAPLRLGRAALSADGTTVAWMGAHLPAQVPLLPDEQKTITELDSLNSFPYVEPLWRRVADGPGAPTRRIIGGGDPLALGCPVGGTLTTQACDGPFPTLTKGKPNINGAVTGWLGVNAVNGVPQLNADGTLVSLIGNPIGGSNVYLVDMRAGLSRRQAMRELTREVSVSATDPTAGFTDPKNIPLNGFVFDDAISADGNRMLVATARQRFPLAPPNLVTAPPAQVGMVELYLIDLEGDTIQRVTHGFGDVGEPSLVPNFTPSTTGADGATSPSLSANGQVFAFASTASNLVPGDGNDASDAFAIEDEEDSRAPAANAISSGPRRKRFKSSKRLTLSAVSLPSGAVQLRAIVPAAGTLRARATGSLEVDAPPRSLALATKRARKRGWGMVRVGLHLPRPLRHLSHTRDGVYALARVSFRRHGGGVLRGEIQVRFHAHSKQERGR